MHGVEVLAGTRERLWVAWRGGLDLREAAESVGVSWEAARRWLAACGGVIPPPSRAGRPGCRYQRLTVEERETIGLLLAAGRSLSEVARAIGRDKSTISRERHRHARRDGSYRPLTAQKRAEHTARTEHVRERKLSRPGPLRDYVVQGLRDCWSPQEIAYRLRREHPDDPVTGPVLPDSSAPPHPARRADGHLSPRACAAGVSQREVVARGLLRGGMWRTHVSMY